MEIVTNEVMENVAFTMDMVLEEIAQLKAENTALKTENEQLKAKATNN